MTKDNVTVHLFTILSFTEGSPAHVGSSSIQLVGTMTTGLEQSEQFTQQESPAAQIRV